MADTPLQLPAFAALGVAEKFFPSLIAKGFNEPTAIQTLAIPALLNDDGDLIGQALTGTGKTAAFGLPVLQHTVPGAGVQALILTPTRELALQVAEELRSLAPAGTAAVLACYGGQDIAVQLAALKHPVDAVVGTPGRVMDLYRRGKLPLDHLRYAVLDEADEMLDMGFIDDIREILSLTNRDKQTLLFSATMPPEIVKIADEFLREGFRVLKAGGEENVNTGLTEQCCYEVKREEKTEALCRLLGARPGLYAMVFCRTKADVEEVTEELQRRHYPAEALHGDLSQFQRTRVMELFKARKFPLLIATDVAARGLDVNDLTCVINYSLPGTPESYIHRIGRTGRAGHRGEAVSFVTPRERRKLAALEQAVKVTLERRTLPTVAELIELKKNRFAEKVSELLAEPENTADLYNFAAELCTLGDSPEQVLAAVLKLHFRQTLSPADYHELGAKERTGDWRRLVLLAGRENGVTLPLLLQEISGRAGVRSNALGKIICRARQTFIEAEPAEARQIIAAFKGDREWRIKYDEFAGREERPERRKRPVRREETAGEPAADTEPKTPPPAAAPESEPDKPPVPERKPVPEGKKTPRREHHPGRLRENFFGWLAEEEAAEAVAENPPEPGTEPEKPVKAPKRPAGRKGGRAFDKSGKPPWKRRSPETPEASGRKRHDWNKNSFDHKKKRKDF